MRAVGIEPTRCGALRKVCETLAAPHAARARASIQSTDAESQILHLRTQLEAKKKLFDAIKLIEAHKVSFQDCNHLLSV